MRYSTSVSIVATQLTRWPSCSASLAFLNTIIQYRYNPYANMVSLFINNDLNINMHIINYDDLAFLVPRTNDVINTVMPSGWYLIEPLALCQTQLPTNHVITMDHVGTMTSCDYGVTWYTCPEQRFLRHILLHVIYTWQPCDLVRWHHVCAHGPRFSTIPV